MIKDALDELEKHYKGLAIDTERIDLARKELAALRVEVAALTHLRELAASKEDPTLLECLRAVTYAADEVLEYDEGHRVFRLMRAVSVASGLLGTGTAGWGSALAAKGFQYELVQEARPNVMRKAEGPPAKGNPNLSPETHYVGYSVQIHGIAWTPKEVEAARIALGKAAEAFRVFGREHDTASDFGSESEVEVYLEETAP